MKIFTTSKAMFYLVLVICSVSAASAYTGYVQDDARFEEQRPTKGREFVFAFMDNCLHEQDDVTGGPTVLITAPREADADVVVNVTMPLVEFFETMTIPAGGQGTVQLPLSAVPHGAGTFNNGIRLDASHDVFVYGLAVEDRHSRSDGFQAIPVPAANLQETRYVVVSLKQKKGNNRRYSQFVAVGIADLTSVSIELTAEITHEGITYQPGNVVNLNLTKHMTLYVRSLGDLTGTKVVAKKPIGLLSGVDCGGMKLRHSLRSGCGHMVEQLPPVESWGRYFIYHPLLGGPNSRRRRNQGTDPVKDVLTKLKIVSFEEDTDVLIVTSSGRMESQVREIDVSGTEMVQITAFKPVLVVAYVLYHGACEKTCRKRSPSMSVIPPLSPPAPEIAFATLNATDRNERASMTHYFSVMYDCGCFRRITWDDNKFSLASQVGFATIRNKFCWTQYEIEPGQYHISSGQTGDAEPCFVSALLFGHGTNGGYAFPLGLDGEGRGSQEVALASSTAAGSEFFMAFAAYFRATRKGPKLVIYRASSTEDATPIQGSINSGLFSQPFTIPVGKQKIEVELPASVVMTNDPRERRYPVEVRSWGRVLVYGVNSAFTGMRMDAFLALPLPMMGREYFLVSSPSLSSYSDKFSMIIVTGLYDETVISFQLRGSLFYNNQVYYGGTTVEFLFNRRQTVFFMTVEDQTGTRIIASKPISVMSGTTCGYSAYEAVINEARCGHMLEYLPPVERWGRTFVTAAFQGYEERESTVYVIASRANTHVTINRDQHIYLSAGNTYTIYLSNTRGLHTLIEADKPVLVYQVPNVRPLNHTSGNSIPSLTLIPNIDESGDDVHSEVQNALYPLLNLNIGRRNDTKIFAQIVARCSSASSISLNGVSLPSTAWSEPLFSSEFCVSTQEMDDQVDYQLQTNGTKASVIVYGFSPEAGYSSPGTM